MSETEPERALITISMMNMPKLMASAAHSTLR
jgi:hypothetical protein